MSINSQYDIIQIEIKVGDYMEITRGDTFEFRFQRKNQNKEVITEKPDKMYFTVKENDRTEDYLFQKRLNNNTISYDEVSYYYNITIDPEDTNNLSYGTYYYDIEVITNNKVKTIAKGQLSITSEITFESNEV